MADVTGDFRRYLYPRYHPRLADVRGLTAAEYARVASRPGTFTGGLVAGWTPLYRRPFRGVTEDGTLRRDAHPLTPARPSEAAPVAAMVDAAEALVALLDDDDRARLCHEVDAVEWQTWANPEFLQFDTGVRLERTSDTVRAAVLDLVRASLSPDGYDSVRNTMRINGFLGETVDLPTILGEWSYNVALYGRPHLTEPWGWQLFGHHLAVNCLVVDGRMTIGPAFLGAEPDEIDAGPHAGVHTLGRHTAAMRRVMAALDPSQRDRATIYRDMVDPAMPPGRVHPGDERHLAGAFQDNRVIPFEGIRVADTTEAAELAALDAVAAFLHLLPDGPRRAALRDIAAHRDETWFCWIGGHGEHDVFYARIQSPVILVEVDHHCGVFLDYDEPKPFHVHTVLRIPHGNDYGRSWVRHRRRTPSPHS